MDIWICPHGVKEYWKYIQIEFDNRFLLQVARYSWRIYLFVFWTFDLLSEMVLRNHSHSKLASQLVGYLVSCLVS